MEETFTKLFDMQFVRVNCGDVFLSKLKGVTDPEEKRHIIGDAFYEVFGTKLKSAPTAMRFSHKARFIPTASKAVKALPAKARAVR